MSVSDEKLKKIQDIHDLWRGNFIRDYSALSQIGDVLKEKHVEMKNVKLMNTDTGECIAEFESGMAIVNQ
ncbi:hypothetical protein MKZ02_19505 [Pseudobacillus sp. FSL P4-0506]|uniref:hypothetical protein n=1 Tax=Pseudobacillus sp. FSL P4-0506 TaxID=2921576 RepID=UPI0030F584AA